MDDATPTEAPIPAEATIAPEASSPLTRCRHLLCKEMLVFGAEYLSMHADEEEPGSGFWCIETQTARGPDGGLVALRRCTSSRQCFEAL